MTQDNNNDNVEHNIEQREARLKQYERLTEDWRFHHKLIWEIPTISVAIMAGILAVSFTQLQSSPWPRFILLSAGAALLFGLTVAIVKHRFGADYRSQYIEESEKELGIRVLPLSTRGAFDKMSEDGKEVTGDRFYRLIARHVSAEIFLMYLTLSATIVLAFLAVYHLPIKLA